MRNQLYVTIPTPCHENWQNMTPADKGRFCQSCAKQVVDFTMMTDNEVLNYFKKATGPTCGRFMNDQLQRPLQPVKQDKKKAWWIAAMMPLLLFFKKVDAQKKAVAEDTAIGVNTNEYILMGKVATPQIVAESIPVKRNITGVIFDTEGKPVPFANVQITGKGLAAIADSSGMFSFSIMPANTKIKMQVFALGYSTATVDITNDDEYIVTIQQEAFNLVPVKVSAHSSEKCLVTMGGAISVTTLSYRSVPDTLRNLFFSPPFKIYPNPVQRGSGVNISVKQGGGYSFQIFDNSGKPVLIKEFAATKGSLQTQIIMPASLAAGVYYVRVIVNETKKQYTDKIVVM
ncbi:MAG TPA: carboxypeptidase-like regulatory domain-containing protein [Chitinophagaceae bacterium]|nr:carboxypeptidase-like regulatory domain-containing protein [Chitinophagaceae bacterium]